MTSPIRFQGSVIFVADLPRMTQFYRALTAWPISERGDSHIRLRQDTQEICLHVAFGMEGEVSFSPRTDSATKMVFVAESRAISETVVAEGGTLFSNREWSDGGLVHLDGADPEGNIFQLVFPE